MDTIKLSLSAHDLWQAFDSLAVMFQRIRFVDPYDNIESGIHNIVHRDDFEGDAYEICLDGGYQLFNPADVIDLIVQFKPSAQFDYSVLGDK